MTVQEIFRRFPERNTHGKQSHLECELLLAETLGVDKETIFRDHTRVLDVLQEERFRSFWYRRSQGEPVAYILQKKEFYGLEFFVDPRVMIPRPETELLVDEVLSFLKQTKFREARILDMGTGSGNIALTLAKFLPQASVTASDLSQDALEVCRLNAQRHRVSLEICQSDLLDAFRDESFDVIVANLPYIGTREHHFVSQECMQYEPHTALFSGEDGLECYRRLFHQMCQLPWKPRFLCGEIGFLQGPVIFELLRRFFPHAQVMIQQDFAGLDRIFTCTYA